MLSYLQSGLIVLLALLAAVALIAFLDRAWPSRSRKLVNDVTGWQLGVLGTTYAVILGFMLYTVWTDFRAAEIDVNLEATSLVNIYRLAAALPEPERTTMQRLTLRYADAMLQQEWPAMVLGQGSNAGGLIAKQMWTTILTTRTQNSLEQNSVDHLTSEASNLMDRRNLRQEQAQSRLPSVLWVLLIVGAILTVSSTCLLGNERRWLHYCQVLAVTFVVTVALAAIGDIARPFGGSVSVPRTDFERARVTMGGELEAGVIGRTRQ